jgi:HAD superfamily hydrolase (TIGR01549 family)
VTTPYRAVLFDLFDTLVLFDRERLPLVTIGGKTQHSTAGLLHAVVARHFPDLSLETVHAGLIESWQEAERLRAIDHREVAAPERFAHFLRCVSIDEGQCPPRLVQDLMDTHRHELGKAAEFPAHHAPLLRRLAARYRLAVVSNFDYSPTALDILERAGVTHLFDEIVVSDAIGWRKPHARIFEETLARMRLRPSEALFVGDRIDIDVAGAQQTGMDSAWINRDGVVAPTEATLPTYEIRDLAELAAILGV